MAKKFRIHNANIDIEIEAEDVDEAARRFAEEHPQEAHNAIFIEEA